MWGGKEKTILYIFIYQNWGWRIHGYRWQSYVWVFNWVGLLLLAPALFKVQLYCSLTKILSLLFELIFGICCCYPAVKFCMTLCDPMDCGMHSFPFLHHLLEFAQTHVHWVGDAIQPSHPLLSPSPPALNLSQHQGLLQWVSSLHQVAKVSELQVQHLSFQWIFRVDFL